MIAALLITLAAETLTTLAVLLSIASPHRRLWPPARPGAWGGDFMRAVPRFLAVRK